MLLPVVWDGKLGAVSDLLAGLLGALLATNQPAAVSNLVKHHTGQSVEIANPADPVDKEYRQLLAEDEAAQQDAEKWTQESPPPGPTTSLTGPESLRARLNLRFDLVRRSYESFLARHPDHVQARIAFGSFLNDIGQEQPAAEQWLKARELDPKQPAIWNNLANYYGHNGQAGEAFACYDKALKLAPRESVYYQNLAITVFMFRKEAQQHYDLTEPQLFNRVMALYHKALALDPRNFSLATELAQTYYGFKPPPSDTTEEKRQAEQKHWDEALAAWQNALKLAHDDIEREGVYVHLARANLKAGRVKEAERNLNLVTNEMYSLVKERLRKNLAQQNGKPMSPPPVSLRSPGGSPRE